MRVAQEPDEVNPRVIVTIAVLAALITAGGAWAAWLLSRSGERAIGVGASELSLARWGHPPDERNAIETSLFGSRSGPPLEAEAHGAPPRSAGDGAGHAAGDAAAEHLREYGWRDRQLGTVFIPIERAMLLYAAKIASARGAAERPAPGGAPQSSPPARTAQ